MKGRTSCLQLTRAADYGIRAMLHLAALPDGERCLLATLAEATSAPESFLSKVMQDLCRAKLVASHRGHRGGFEMKARGRQATMGDIIEIIDGPLRLNACVGFGGMCNRSAQCPAHPIWARAEAAVLEALHSATIAEMVGQSRVTSIRSRGLLS